MVYALYQLARTVARAAGESSDSRTVPSSCANVLGLRSRRASGTAPSARAAAPSAPKPGTRASMAPSAPSAEVLIETSRSKTEKRERGGGLRVISTTSKPAAAMRMITSCEVQSSSTRPYDFACTASHASPVATSSTSSGRLAPMCCLKASWMSSMSCWNLARASTVVSPKGVMVRLNRPAVNCSQSTSMRVRSLFTLGSSATTPIDPINAKGAAQMRSAHTAIMYPPDAATVSTATVVLMPACFNRSM
mmetsp:Transcript_22257/g.56414  ORF Transcript_22257/g.56414 Transcript_22257/m.56414 type:complete len:249 (+) Transcript_22257:138-884(+)